MTTPDETHGHILSSKSSELERDAFIFIRQRGQWQLYLGLNQKLLSATSASLHRWVALMTCMYQPETFFLCPVSVEPVGIMVYGMTPSGSPIEPDDTTIIAPGNYGLYFDRECTISGTCTMSSVSPLGCDFAVRFTEQFGSVLDPFPPPISDAVLARDATHCRLTGTDRAILTWIIPPVVSYETEVMGSFVPWDSTPFFSADNVLTLRPELAHSWYSNHFTVDVDDGYRILLLHPQCAVQAHQLPTHLPPHPANGASDTFLRLHCRLSLALQVRGGDIRHEYSSWTISAAMDALGVDGDESEMVSLNDARWQTVLGKEILRHVLERRTAASLYSASKAAETEQEDEGEDEDDDDDDDGEELSRQYGAMDLHFGAGITV
ncbi:hypothetical protein C8R46DRAFT_1206289 [Mycena filopes]|nr:hypothetical protein C8R46DRAFT_1206289 [Mycena filopes]